MERKGKEKKIIFESWSDKFKLAQESSIPLALGSILNMS